GRKKRGVRGACRAKRNGTWFSPLRRGDSLPAGFVCVGTLPHAELILGGSPPSRQAAGVGDRCRPFALSPGRAGRNLVGCQSSIDAHLRLLLFLSWCPANPRLS